MVLVAIAPPDHVQERAFRAQDELFRRYGIASARALPPIVVVGRWDDAAPTPETTGQPSPRRHGPRSSLDAVRDRWSLPAYRIDSVTNQAGRIFAETTLADACARLADVVGASPLESDSGSGRFWSPAGSLFLGEADAMSGHTLPTHPLGPDDLFPGPLRSATVVLLEIFCEPGATTWWHSVRWTVKESRRARTPRDG